MSIEEQELKNKVYFYLGILDVMIEDMSNVTMDDIQKWADELRKSIE